MDGVDVSTPVVVILVDGPGLFHAISVTVAVAAHAGRDPKLPGSNQ